VTDLKSHPGDAAFITISTGVAATETCGGELRALWACADAALYAAKRATASAPALSTRPPPLQPPLPSEPSPSEPWPSDPPSPSGTAAAAAAPGAAGLVVNLVQPSKPAAAATA